MTTLERPVDLVSHESGHSRKSQNEQVAVQHRSEPRVENLEGEALVEEMLARKRRACVRSMIREHPTEPAICGVHELRTRDRQLHCPLCVHPAGRAALFPIFGLCNVGRGFEGAHEGFQVGVFLPQETDGGALVGRQSRGCFSCFVSLARHLHTFRQR